MTPHERHLSSPMLAPALLLISVAAAIVVHLGAPLPLAGAVALAAWGTALAGMPGRGRVLLALIVYVPLVALAIAAQLDAAKGGGSGREFVAAMDAGAAFGLLMLLLRRV